MGLRYGWAVAMAMALVACTDGSPASGPTATNPVGATARSATTQPDPVETAAPTRSPKPSTTPTTLEPGPPPTTDPPFPLRDLDRHALLELWAQDRADAVSRITNAGWGVRDGVLHGPGGLTENLADCPGGWRDDGPAGEPVRLLWWKSLHWGPGPESAQAYLDWLGEEATAGGRPIELLDVDWDAYDPVGTDEQRAEMGDSNRRKLGGFGEQATAVAGFTEWDQSRSFPALLDEQCLPTLAPRYRGDGAAAFPWYGPTPTQSHAAEAVVWAEHAARTTGAGKAAMIVIDNEWGDRFSTAVHDAAHENGTSDRWLEFRHEQSAVDLDRQVEAALDAGATAMFLATAGQPCVSIVDATRERGSDIPIILPNNCTQFYAYIEPLGTAARHIASVFGSLTATEGPFAGSPLARDVAEQAARLPYGAPRLDEQWFGTWFAVEVLKIAGELPGGVTRSNVVLAAWSFSSRYPLATGTVDTSWPNDVELIDEAGILEWDPSTRRWAIPLLVGEIGRESVANLTREALIARWADERRATVDRITDAGWGVQNELLIGPGGVVADLSECPPHWLIEGPATGEVTLQWWVGTHHSSPGGSARRFLEWLGEAGRVGGRPVTLAVQHDAVRDWDAPYSHVADVRQQNLDRVAEAAATAIAVIGFGENAHNVGFRDLFADVCVPSIASRLLLPRTPSTSGWIGPSLHMTLQTETAIWQGWLDDRGYDSEDSVAVVAMDNERGAAMVDVLEAARRPHGPSLRVIWHDPADHDLADEAALALGTDPRAVLVASFGYPCPMILEELQQLDPTTTVLIPSLCPIEGYHTDVRASLTNVLRFVSRYEASEAQMSTAPLAATARDAEPLTECCIYSVEENWVEAWHAIQVLQVADDLPGGLTRPNIALAAMTHVGTHPFLEGAAHPGADTPIGAIRLARLHEWSPRESAWLPTDDVFAPTR